MSTAQILSIAIIAAMMTLFVWGRLRYDVVAGLSLLASVVAGIVPADKAFSGFSDDIVVIVASALVVSAAVARSGLVDDVLGLVAPRVRGVRAQLIVLVGIVTLMSGIIKNIGALAMMLPAAFQFARRSNVSPSIFLMPMAFGALLGGLITLVGTSPNIIVARLRAEMTGEPFRMFDFTPVGLGLAIAGVAFLAVFYRLLPQDRKGAVSLDEALDIKDYVTEVRVPDAPESPTRTIADLKKLVDADITVMALVREGKRNASPLPDATLNPGDILILKGESAALARLVSRAGLKLEGDELLPERRVEADIVSSVEAVIGPTSPLVGQSAARMVLRERYQVNLLAVSRSGQRLAERLRDVTLRAGDVVVLRGPEAVMPERLRDLGTLPLVERTQQLGDPRRAWITGAILIATIVTVAFSLVPLPIAFATAALALVLFGALPLREAYDAVEWPIVIMLAALIPVSEAVRTTGTAELVAHWLSQVGILLPGWGALALILVTAMAVTPFLNNAATVLMMAPIAASFASTLGYRPDAFLMAVAIGSGCDFLTPIGHQCNTLVMGPGGYKFGDYARLGAPLSLLVIVLGVPLIMIFWPLG